MIRLIKRLTPLADSGRRSRGHSGGSGRSSATGYLIGPSEFAHRVNHAIEELQSEFDTGAPRVITPDPDLRRSPLRAVNAVAHLQEGSALDWRPLGEDLESTIGVHAIGGTGYLLWRDLTADVNSDGVLDWVVQSHRLQRAARTGCDPGVRQRLLAALSYARLGRRSVLLDQPLRECGYAGVPERVARMVMAAGHFPCRDLRYGVRLVGYDEVRLPRVPTGTAVTTGCDVTDAIARAVANLDVQFDPAAWAFWRDDPLETPPTRDSSTVWVVLPRWVDEQGELGATVAGQVGDASETVTTVYADVDRAHVLKFRGIDDEWLEEFEREAIEHVDERIRAGDTPMASEWRHMCAQTGATDPVQRWEQYRAAHVDPSL